MPLPVAFRVAVEADLDAIHALLVDDELARSRAGFTAVVSAVVRDAFARIRADPDDEVWVGLYEGSVIATAQLTILNGLSRGGMRRGLLEAVRVRADLRGHGVGARMVEVLAEHARERGCGLLQLTSDLRRTEAHRFYARLGFEPSHLGMKRNLVDDSGPR